jgi:hypothetical protein
MPDIVINHMNNLADLDNGKRSNKIRANINDKIYFRRGGPLEENEIDENGFGVNDSDFTPSNINDGIIPFIGEGRHLSDENYQGDEPVVLTGGEPNEQSEYNEDTAESAIVPISQSSQQLVGLDDNGIPSEYNEVNKDQGGTIETQQQQYTHHDVVVDSAPGKFI